MTLVNTLKDFAGDIASECSRNCIQIVKLKKASTYISLLASLRRASFVLFGAIFFVVLACVSLLLTLAAAVVRASMDLPTLDPLLYLGLVLFIFSSAACLYFNSERVWIRFGEVDRILAGLKESQAK